MPLRVVAQHPLIPAVGDGIQPVAQFLEPGHVGARQQRQGFIGRDRRRQVAVDAARRGDRRRIDAQPAAARDPHFGPGMGVVLADFQVAVHRIDFTALVAGDHARRNPGGTQGKHKGGGEVLAEATLRVEEEFVDHVGAQQRRVERIDQQLLVEEVSRGREDRRAVVAMLCPPGGGDGAVARVAVFRQRQRTAQNARRFIPAGDGLGPGPLHIACAVADRLARDGLIVAGQPALRRQRGRHLEGKQPVLAVGLQGDFVIQRRARPGIGDLEIGSQGLGHAPAASVEGGHDRTAPVKLRLRRYLVLELHPERDRIRLRELRDRTGRHAVGQARDS